MGKHREHKLDCNCDACASKIEYSNFKHCKPVAGPRGFKGKKGSKGSKGSRGSVGRCGPKGDRGSKGYKGDRGEPGKKGDQGRPGPKGCIGPRGCKGEKGAPGASGLRGRPGDSGPVLGVADFYALSPGDNTLPISGDTDTACSAGNAVRFPHDGPSGGLCPPQRINSSEFRIAFPGTYKIEFNVPVTEAAQLGLSVNCVLVPESVFGRDAGLTQISGVFTIYLQVSDVVSIVNPSGNSDITITPSAGGNQPVASHLIITRLL